MPISKIQQKKESYFKFSIFRCLIWITAYFFSLPTLHHIDTKKLEARHGGW